MCMWVIDITKHKVNTDIVCYKILNKDLTSYVKKFQYELNKEFTTKLGIPRQEYNSYNTPRLIVDEGFHGCVNYNDANRPYKELKKDNDILLVACIIPKNSEFYFNHFTGFIVSEKIKIEKILK